MREITLTKENASKLDVKCGKPCNFYKHEMVFFKTPVTYTFRKPIMLKRCAYSMLMCYICKNDQDILNEMLTRIESDMRICETSFIDSMENNGNVQTIADKCMITVEIKGYKKTDDGVCPIWKLKSIETCSTNKTL